MTARLRSDFWVAAHLRRCASQGVTAVLRRRGAAEAGAIFVKVDRLDGTAALYGPAPQTAFDEGETERRFMRTHAPDVLDTPTIEQRIRTQSRFDPDLWLIEVEDRAGRSFLDMA